MMMSDGTPRLLLFDLDGTLVRSDHSVDPAIVQALLELQERGVRVGFATGRPLFGAREIIAPIGGSAPSMFFSGSLVVGMPGETRLLERPMTHAEISLLIGEARKNDLHVELYTRDSYYASDHGELSQIHSEYLHRLPTQANLDGIASECAIIKVVMMGVRGVSEERLLEVVERHRESIPCGVSYGAAHPDIVFANFTSREANREAALNVILSECGFSRQEVASFGDATADLEFIERVGFGVAMGNASPEVKGRSRIVADHVDRGGVFPVLQSWFPFLRS